MCPHQLWCTFKFCKINSFGNFKSCFKESLHDFKNMAEEHIQSNVKLLDSKLSDEALRFLAAAMWLLLIWIAPATLLQVLVVVMYTPLSFAYQQLDNYFEFKVMNSWTLQWPRWMVQRMGWSWSCMIWTTRERQFLGLAARCRPNMRLVMLHPPFGLLTVPVWSSLCLSAGSCAHFK